jgi:hypothetical protein
MPIVATIFVTLFLWLSAIPLLSWYEFSAQHQELADAAFQWHQKRVSDYSFEYDYAGPEARRLPVPIRIHVRDSKFMAAYRIADNEEVDMAAFPDVPETIDSVFEIARGLLAGTPTKSPLATMSSCTTRREFQLATATRAATKQRTTFALCRRSTTAADAALSDLDIEAPVFAATMPFAI